MLYPTEDPYDVPDDGTLREMEERDLDQQEIETERYNKICYERFQDLNQ